MKVLHVTTGALLAAGLSFTAAHAEMVKMKANLTSAQEVPANDSKGKGTAEITVDTTGKKVMFTVNFEGLSGDAVAAHIHGPAEAGANAGVIVNIGMAGGLKSPIKGELPLTDAQIADVTAGKSYVNVHTAANKGGEIRGQITK
ncbi:MAG: CHRD domain-containing protein [Rhodospirillaceae bacterium]|nr:CHRD domain-containing protein [Rhodospirillaceae bacterium]